MWNDYSGSIETKVDKISKKQIIIMTYREMSSLESDIETFVIMDFDQVASSPFFSNRINLFRKILDLKSNGAKKVILFSDDESEYLHNLTSGNWRDFLSRELADRKRSQLPPYSVPVEISSSSKTESSAISKINELSDQFKSKILKISLPTVKKGNRFFSKQILFLRRDFREIDRTVLATKSVKVKVCPIDYF
jgi:primosomal protein N'